MLFYATKITNSLNRKMITITLWKNKKDKTEERTKKSMLILQSNYCYRSRLAKIPQSYFDYAEKAWIAPISSLDYIQKQFKGEIYYKTPEHIIEGTEPKKREHVFFDKEAVLPEAKMKPYPYQEYGAKFMIDSLNHFGFCLNSDSMGLGKSFQSILVMMYQHQNAGCKKVLIICKKSIKTQWAEEIRKFSNLEDDMKICITEDSKAKRVKAYEEAKESEECILITNYHNFLNDSEMIKNIGFQLVIIDEAHSVKGRTGKMNNNIARVIYAQKAKTILLTGTPIMSKPDDIFGIVQLANHTYFGRYRDFENRYLVIDYGVYGRQIVGAKNLNELRRKLFAFTIRRMPEDVAIELPDIVEFTVKAPMDKTQNSMYAEIMERKDALLARKEQVLNSLIYSREEKNYMIMELNEKEKMYIATMQLISDDPRAFLELSAKEKTLNTEMAKAIPKNYKGSQKTEMTIDKVEEIISEDEKVIIFTHFASTARMLEKEIEKNLKVKPAMYTGKETNDVREKNIFAFKNDPSCQILIGTDAAAEGLNLQVAKYMIHYEQPDTNAQKQQRIGRIKRIGSAYDKVVSMDMCTEGSFDEVKLKKMEKDKLIAESLA